MNRTQRKTDDLILLVERIVSRTEEGGEETLTLQTHMVRALLERAKRAPLPGPGRPTVSGRDMVRDRMTVSWARRRKAAILTEANAKGRSMTAAEAGELAAKEASRRSRLSETEILQRMQRGTRR